MGLEHDILNLDGEPGFTLPEPNKAPENSGISKGNFHLPTIDFQESFALSFFLGSCHS